MFRSVSSTRVPPAVVGDQRAQVAPIPVLLWYQRPVPIQDVEALHRDARFGISVTDRLSPEWTSFAQRVSGTIIVTDTDPMSALVYAVTAGVKGSIVLVIHPRYKGECKQFILAGASACLTTPVTAADLDRLMPLLAMNASLSRVDSTLGLLLDPITMSVRFREQCVRLTQREFAVLQCLSSYHGRPVAAHKLVTYVWGERATAKASRNLLDVYVFQLRRKLERLGLRNAISTVRGVGYALSHAQFSDGVGVRSRPGIPGEDASVAVITPVVRES